MKKNIWIIDDDSIIRKVLEKLLIENNFNVIVFESGIKCIKETENPNNNLETPDLILLDYKMPLMNGDEVFKTLEQNSQLKETKIIVLSASENVKEIFESKNLYPYGYMSKPFDQHSLIKEINLLLEI